MRALAARIRTSAWLGWQIESNWADPYVFVIYSVMRPLATALILAGMYWAVAGEATRRDAFPGFYLANAFHVYVIQLVVGMGWLVIEEREEYETLKYVYTSPIGMFTYLTGRASVKLMLATVSAVLALLVGWFLLGLRWDWSQVAWAPLAFAVLAGIGACLFLGYLVAGVALLMPRVAMTVNEGLAVCLYLLCGVIFPVDLLPAWLRGVSLALPFPYWYEAVRRFLLGEGSSSILGRWPDGTLILALGASAVVFSILSARGYLWLERRARREGRLDQTTLF